MWLKLHNSYKAKEESKNKKPVRSIGEKKKSIPEML